jgi:hypothetical protein
MHSEDPNARTHVTRDHGAKSEAAIDPQSRGPLAAPIRGVPACHRRGKCTWATSCVLHDLSDRIRTLSTPIVVRAPAWSENRHPSSVSGRTLAVQNHSVAKGRREQLSAAAAQQPAAAVAIRCTPLTSKAAGHETTGVASLTRSKPPLRL